MPALDELSEEARRNTRGRFEQWVKNPKCEANALSAVLNVKLSDVAKSLGYTPEYGQSPFAITRGLAFEGWLFKDQAKVMRESLIRVGELDAESEGFLDLRLTINGGSKIKSVEQALMESNRLLNSLATEASFKSPTIVAGLLVKIPKGVMLPEATLIIDVATIHHDANTGFKIRVGEIKVFPDRGGYTDKGEIATARAQAGVYQHALQLTVDAMNLESNLVVDTRGFLVFTWPGTNSPTIRANEDLTYQARRAELGFDQLDSIAQDLFAKQEQKLNEIDLKTWIAHSQTEYRESCWSFCDLAPRCQDLAISDGRGVLLGATSAKLLGTVTIPRAIELMDGQSPSNPVEEALQNTLQDAMWSYHFEFQKFSQTAAGL